MTLPLYYYVLGTPLGVLGLVRWSCWLVRRIPAVLYRPITGGVRLPLTVVVPVYEEDPDIFATAIESWLANGVDEIILVIDVSDSVCQAIAARYPVRVLVTEVPGKRDALRRGWNAARTELVALVDSDTVWANDVAIEVCRPFADPVVGGVGTRQSVYGSRGFLARITDMFLDHRYFDENASQSLLGGAVSCLSGRTAVYRRALLLEVEQEFMNETFWGVRCLSGDDKRLTTLILERGHRTYMQRTAEVWSTFPDTWRVFFRQRLRWARNTWRSDLRALSNRWVWSHPFLAYTMVDKGISSFTLLVGPAFLIYSMIIGNWVFVAVLVAWWQISRAAKLLPHVRRRPSSFFFMLPYVVVSWVMALIKLQALLTIRRQRWLTRHVAVEDGTIVRTGDVAAGLVLEPVLVCAQAAVALEAARIDDVQRPLMPAEKTLRKPAVVAASANGHAVRSASAPGGRQPSPRPRANASAPVLVSTAEPARDTAFAEQPTGSDGWSPVPGSETPGTTQVVPFESDDAVPVDPDNPSAADPDVAEATEATEAAEVAEVAEEVPPQAQKTSTSAGSDDVAKPAPSSEEVSA